MIADAMDGLGHNPATRAGNATSLANSSRAPWGDGNARPLWPEIPISGCPCDRRECYRADAHSACVGSRPVGEGGRGMGILGYRHPFLLAPFLCIVRRVKIRRLLMASSAVVMGLLGLGATFLPHELLAYLQQPDSALMALLVQLLGGLYLGFAMMNWMARDTLIGGIYNRPGALGNFLHFFIGAMSAGREAVDTPSAIFLLLAGVYWLFAAGFGYIAFTSPIKRTAESS